MTLDVQQASFVRDRLRDPLPVLIAAHLEASIRAGRLAPGAQLPSEPKLAEMFGVSRNTIREAIRSLLAKGILEGRKGIGTFVHVDNRKDWPVETGIEELTSTTEMITAAGYTPGCRDYRLDVVPCPAEAAAALLLESGARVYRLTRVRLADDQPVIVCTDILPVDRIGERVMRRFKGQGSLFSFLADHCGLSIAVARTALKPILPDAAIAAALALAPHEPILLLKQTHFDERHQPVIYSENYINSSFIGFHVRRTARSPFQSRPVRPLSGG
jgi:GntR family transcriptional regulator